jgi:hypothetical protein
MKVDIDDGEELLVVQQPHALVEAEGNSSLHYSPTTLRSSMMRCKDVTLPQEIRRAAGCVCFRQCVIEIITLSAAVWYLSYGSLFRDHECLYNLAMWARLTGLLALTFQICWHLPFVELFPPLVNNEMHIASPRRRILADSMELVGICFYVAILASGAIMLIMMKPGECERNLLTTTQVAYMTILLSFCIRGLHEFCDWVPSA